MCCTSSWRAAFILWCCVFCLSLGHFFFVFFIIVFFFFKQKTEYEMRISDCSSAVCSSDRAARLEPTRHGYVNAVQVYPFTRGALYRLYAAPEQVSDIALQPGEKLVAVSAGDTVRWVVGDTTSGTGDEQQVHVLVKPVAPDLKTNLVITTDRRAYHLEMESTEGTYMASVSWHYPHEIGRASCRDRVGQYV